MEKEHPIEQFVDFKKLAKALKRFNFNQAFKDDQVGISKSYGYKLLEMLTTQIEELSSETDEDLSDLRRKIASGLTALSLLLGLIPGLLLRDPSRLSASMYFQLALLKNIDDKADTDDVDASAFIWVLLFRGLARLNRGIEIRTTSAWTSVNRDILALYELLSSEQKTQDFDILREANSALEYINAIRGKDVDVSFNVSLQYGFDQFGQIQDAHLLIRPVVHERDDVPNGIEFIPRQPVDEDRINRSKEFIDRVHRDFVQKLDEFSPSGNRAASQNIYRKMGFILPQKFLAAILPPSDKFFLKAENPVNEESATNDRMND